MAVEFPRSYPGFDSYATESIPQAPPGAPSKAGQLELVFEPDRNGRTRLTHDRARVPYHLSGTLAHDPHPDAATVRLQSTTGGIAQGDRLRADIHAGADSVAVVSTQSATKVQSMTRNYAAERTILSVESGAHLEYVPEPTILHEDARFARETTLTVPPDATAIFGDCVVPGRLAHGERFAFEAYASRVRLERAASGDPLFEDATHLRPATDRTGPEAPGVQGEFPVRGALYVLTDRSVEDGALADRLHERLTNGPARGGATTLPNDAGVFVRVLAGRTEGAIEALHAARDGARQSTIGVGTPDARRY